MGDMKTPDFDDLLAAFDIPDATSLDAKEPVQESHDEAEGQLKHTEMCMEDSVSVHQAVGVSDVPAVSVIVKNTSHQESPDSGVEGPHFNYPLQNGFRGSGVSMDSHQINHCGSKSFVCALKGGGSRGLLGKTPVQQKPEGTPSFSQSFSQFSPISSPESEDTPSNGVDVHPKQERPYFPAASIFMSAEPPMSDNQKKQLSYSMFDQCHKVDCEELENLPRCKGESIKAKDTRTEVKPDSNASDQKDKGDCQSAVLPASDYNIIESSSNNIVGTSKMLTSHPCVKTPTSKLSSCLEALVALNARNYSSEPLNSGDLSVAHDGTMNVSPKIPMSPQSPRSSPEAVKRLMKPPDSPVSISSDSSGKGSPALASGSPPAIPRVRIKTIKTTTGQIQRMVTSVVPDSENEEVLSVESSPSQRIIVEAYSSLSPYPSHNVISDIIVDMPIKSTPVGILPSKVTDDEFDDKLKGNSKRPRPMQSPTIFHNTSGPVMRPMPVAQHGPSTQKRISSVQTGNSPNASFLPKAMHLANLNLVPHSVAASVAARSTSHQQSQQHALSSSMVCSTVPLVHQVKKNTPNPCAAIPSTAAGTLNRLLNNANPVPTFVPNLNPPPESNIHLPPRGYCCLECGDSFGVERSLAYHYGRRSVHIEVACTHCAKTMVFFNKCALLAHAREHKNKGVVMQCTQLSMKPIAEGQMFVPLLAESSLHGGSHVPPLSSPKTQPVMPLYAEKVIRHRLCCLECNKQLSDYRGLAGHYQRLSEEMEGLMCKVCPMLLPNKCSFRAHQRIHAHKSPYCCPECGALSRSVDIQKHVKENCLHYARKAGYKCLHCDMVFMSFNVQKSHIEEKHCEVFYKCTICPVAFKSSDGCQMHLTTKHNASVVSPQLIFKCSCETVFKKKQLLLQHFHQNAKKLITCVFKCPECTSIFTHKQSLMQHFKGVHEGIFKEVEKSTKPTEMTAQHQDVTSAFHQPKVNTPIEHSDATRKRAHLTARDRKTNLKNAGWTCGECLHWLPDREVYVSHMKNNHGRSLKRYPCRQCERSFNSSTSLRRHIRNDHNGKRTFTCWYCTDERTTFTTNIMLKNHISLMHGIKNPDFSLSKSTPLDTSKALGEGLVSKRPAVASQREGEDGAALEGSSTKRLKSHFRCAKCGFTSEDGTQFQQHIPQHKTDKKSPQCLHCGLCFASQLSLNRHLFIVHKVKDPEEEKKEMIDVEYESRKKQEEDVGKTVGVNEGEDLPPPLVKSDPSREEDPTRLHCETAVRPLTFKSTYITDLEIHGKSSRIIESISSF